jgi:hypothetical protein
MDTTTNHPGKELSPTEHEQEWLSAAKIFEFIIAPATVLTAQVYLMGWIYKQNYYASFGIQHESLDFPPQYYLTASWTSFFLGIALLLAGAASAGFAFSVKGEVTEQITPARTRLRIRPHGLARIGFALVPSGIVWLVILSRIMFFPPGEDILSRLFGSQDLMLGCLLLLWTCIVIALLRRRQTLLQKPRFFSVAFWLIVVVIVIFYIATLLGLAGWLGLYHARGAIGCSKLPLPEIILCGSKEHPLSVPEPTETLLPNPMVGSNKPLSVYCYVGLRLIAFNDDQYYVFRPGRTSVDEKWQPQVYVVSKDQVIYVELKPPKIFYPVY